jgi:hypothetical protein
MTSAFRRFALALGGSVAMFGSAFCLPNDAVAAIAAIVAIFLGLPLSLPECCHPSRFSCRFF